MELAGVGIGVVDLGVLRLGRFLRSVEVFRPRHRSRASDNEDEDHNDRQGSRFCDLDVRLER